MKIKFTPLEKALEIVAAGLLAVLIIYVIANWAAVPETLPMHYNFRGEVDSYGSKNGMQLLLLVPIALYAGLTALEFFPGIWNMPASPQDSFYLPVVRLTRTLMICTKALLNFVFGVIMFCVMWSAPLPGWFMPVLFAGLALIFVWYGLSVRRARRAKRNNVA